MLIQIEGIYDVLNKGNKLYLGISWYRVKDDEIMEHHHLQNTKPHSWSLSIRQRCTLLDLAILNVQIEKNILDGKWNIFSIDQEEKMLPSII